MKLRKYFRGSGRVLAFVFIASIIWLLFDIAALRISINDVNSNLQKELLIKEREATKKQATKRNNVANRDFKHPVQKIKKDRADYMVKVDEVYRKRPNDGRLRQGGEMKAKVPEEIKLEQKVESVRSIVTESNEKELVKHMTNESNPKLNMRPAFKEPALNISKVGNATGSSLKAKTIKVTTGLIEEAKDKVKEVIKDETSRQNGKTESLALPKAPSPVQEESRHPAQQKKIPGKLDMPEKVESKSNIDIGQQVNDAKNRNKQSHSENDKKDQHFLKLVSKEDKNKHKVGDIIDRSDVNKTESNLSKDHMSPTLKPKLQPKNSIQVGNSTKVKRSGLHKMMALDVTIHPRDTHAVGQFGQPALVPFGKEQESRSRWNEGHFNVYLSEQIPLDRAIPDTRPQMCSETMVHDDLPSTSVIFCFVDEVWSTLLRSVHSVLNRSPPHLLKEIILVDDFSTKDYLKEPLDKYMSQFPKVRIIRLKERQGLIRARLAGAAVAQGEVLTFLDSHVECNVGWLEPLLERVYLDRRKVACPVIEVISDKDLSYVLVDNYQRGVFKWPLVFGWNTLPEDVIKKNKMKDSDPIRCPVMAGGLFSIDKKYFYELGSYDPGLDVWGGENMEISFKIWMCGGEIEIIPCSRVGHIFRGENPYKFPKDRQKTVERNLARVAEVWLDEYKELFYGHGYHHLLDKSLTNIGNLTEQIQLRQELKCKSFKWYLENVYPDMEAPLVKAEGLIFNRGTRKCLALQNGSLSFEICDLSKQHQHFNYTWMRMVRQQASCLAPQGLGPNVTLEQCDITKAHIRWLHKSTPKTLLEHLMVETSPRRVCLEADGKGNSLCLKPCDPSSAFQKWQFTHYYAQ